MLGRLRKAAVPVALAALLGLGAGAGVVYAAGSMQSTPSDVVVACVNNGSGQLRIVSSPSQCTRKEHAVLLQAPAAGGQTSFAVDCAAGEKVGDVLAKVADGIKPVSIVVSGTCVESVTIARDNVTLSAAAAGDGITEPSGENPTHVLRITGRHITLTGLTLTGGSPSVVADDGASFSAEGVRVTEAHGGNIACCTAAVTLRDSSSATLTDLTIDHGEEGGLLVESGSSATVKGGSIDVSLGAVGVRGGWLTMNDTTIRHVEMGGVGVTDGMAELINVTMDGGDAGITAEAASHVRMDGGVIQHAGIDGVHVVSGTVELYGVQITDNRGPGIRVSAGGSVTLSEVAVSANDGDGLRISDVSVGTFVEPPSTIQGNGGWGVWCAPAPAVALIVGDPGDVSGNTAGQISCPTGS